MLDQVLQQIQAAVGPEIARRFNLTPSQAQKSAETLADTVEAQVSKQTQSGALDLLGNLFSKNANTSQSNDFVTQLMGAAGKNLISKVGLDPDTASRIAAEFIPKIVDMVTQKSGGDISSVLAGSGLGGVLGSIGGIFKK